MTRVESESLKNVTRVVPTLMKTLWYIEQSEFATESQNNTLKKHNEKWKYLCYQYLLFSQWVLCFFTTYTQKKKIYWLNGKAFVSGMKDPEFETLCYCCVFIYTVYLISVQKLVLSLLCSLCSLFFFRCCLCSFSFKNIIRDSFFNTQFLISHQPDY